jgi:sugar/nucleoside kinase (ribokinase family)
LGVRKAQFPRIDVVGIGENSIDVLAVVPHHPLPDEKLELTDIRTMPGGQIATALTACARQGCSTRYVGTFGNDSHGHVVEGALQREGVDTSLCRRVDAATRTALILVDAAAGTRTVMWRRDPALDWPAAQMAPDMFSDARVLLVDATDLEMSVRAATLARKAGITVVADVDQARPGLERLLETVDILIAARGLPHELTGNPVLGRAMPKLQARFGMQAIVVTLGAAGAVAWAGAEEIQSPGFAVTVRDPTGAGDAFRGGFVAAWLEQADPAGALPAILNWANATAALSCRAAGAQAGLPSRAEVRALVTNLAAPRSNGHGSAEHRDR